MLSQIKVALQYLNIYIKIMILITINSNLKKLKRFIQKFVEDNFSLYLKEVVGLSDVALEGGATGVKPWPVGVGEVSVREEVVTLGRPGFVGPIQLVQVTAGCGVQQVHLAPLLLLFIKNINIKCYNFTFLL